MNGQPPLTKGSAVVALAQCALRTAVLVTRRQVRQPPAHVGRWLHFADGSTTAVYRETVIARPDAARPAVLVVCFRLRWIRSEWLHALFRLESELNTVLFAGFPGLISKLWCRHDRSGLYRGLYQWDDPALAEAYVRALWFVLTLVSARGSIHYAILPGLRRDGLLENPDFADSFAPDEPSAWWRLVKARVPAHAERER